VCDVVLAMLRFDVRVEALANRVKEVWVRYLPDYVKITCM
jgi:hypothetical protein